MDRPVERLALYGQPSDHETLSWAWAEGQLVAAGLYWVVAATPGHPHPRPVWGVWVDDRLHVSLGSPALRRAFADGVPVTVHLDSAIDVVIVEAGVVGPCDDAAVIAAYDAKYSYEYDLEQYGPFTTLQPTTVLAWRVTGPDGRDGFAQTARFTLS